MNMNFFCPTLFADYEGSETIGCPSGQTLKPFRQHTARLVPETDQSLPPVTRSYLELTDPGDIGGVNVGANSEHPDGARLAGRITL